LSLTGFVTPLLAQQQNQTNATTTQQQQNQTEAGGGAGRTEAPVSEGQQQPGALTPNVTIPSPEAGGGGEGRTEPLP
jgi:hypothetical protein